MPGDRIATLALLAITLTGCTRYGFGSPAGGDAGPPPTTDGDPPPPPADLAPPPGERVPPPPTLVTGANDRCDNPAAIDLGGLQPGESVTLTVDTTHATDDYGVSCCEGKPEVVLKITDGPGNLLLSCNGDGDLHHTGTASFSAATCPPPDDGGCGKLSCSGGSYQTISLAAGTAIVFLCRDPADGPAQVTLRR